MAGGRPSEYREEYCERIVKFFDVEPFVREEYKDSNGSERTRLIPNRLPTLARFAAELDVDRSTLAEWANKTDAGGALVYPKFSRAYKRAKDYQEAFLAEGGLAGAFETPFAIFTAKNVIGWKDKQEVDNTHSAPGGGPIETKNETIIRIVRPSAKDA